MRIIISGGGTGGHIYPGIAIAKKIQEYNPEAKIIFVGSENGLEKKLVPHEGFEIRFISVEGLNKKISLKTFSALKNVFKGFVQSIDIVKDFKPDIVIGTGGYVCGPIVLAASLRGIPTIIHEQNAFPGMTNKLLAHFVNKIAITFKETEKYFPKNKVVFTGNPIRESIIIKKEKADKSYWGLSVDKPMLLVVGGSRGATRINDTIVEIIPKLIQNDIQLLFVTGEKEYDKIIKRIEKMDIQSDRRIVIKPYLFNIDMALNSADLIISRAGATIISEITALGIPSILIPSPNVANNHQEYNALALEQNGAAIVIKESQLETNVFADQVINLILNKEKLSKMSSNAKKLAVLDATDKIYDIITELTNKG
ncbi:UDP-N-acetylglucosamine--N-acetylmuramyl-(pentapeptide) pyrophosphoryl-undecaprenol N-acetylglucosamine transferase [Caloramator mitchellensis]|uniref:UDP-N-acetylglucosamine--N-acetylmuramyl-(pentapeptide) pyrophosphoryl-undecaprenol N-acetylglucosamine transferase n=1 Tax=Caloramator mitchellensis TaxID=908809 RepID=A0A0R3JSV3_CALMK|nr:undecaprenyldiphospho-muramoylpentapeptide beta-N-acetylglucosaminyltransferase [Caloramator mitchellensis]KRQ86585.1 UDP-N-acetylglucosamine--N-acetylmuramyl-(pentapeptide) pyrophosphoryl-undecaprenol N-acetylglucosamine transferase [Caloramator mitchellensis]